MERFIQTGVMVDENGADAAVREYGVWVPSICTFEHLNGAYADRRYVSAAGETLRPRDDGSYVSPTGKVFRPKP